MKLRKLTPGDYFLIIANLVPIFGVWFEGWNAAQVFVVFCLETVIIGLFNVIKMACVTLFVRNKDFWQTNAGGSPKSGFFFILFFIVHYGFFVFVQTQIFFSVSGLVKDHSTFGMYKDIPAILGDNGLLLLLVFIAYYTAQTLFNFFLSGEYKTITMSRLMFQPYGRIFIQQFVVIVGSLFLTIGSGRIFILVLVLVKIAFELFINFDTFLDKAEADTKKSMDAEKAKNQLKS